MARNGSGTYNRPENNFTYPVPGYVIVADEAVAFWNDLSDALTQSISRDGQTVPTANLPMAGYRHTGVSNGNAVTDYCALGQAQGQAYLYAVAGGDPDAITVNLSPTPAGYTTGMRINVKIAAPNVSRTVTLNLNAFGAIAVTKADGVTDLDVGELVTDRIVQFFYDGTVWRYMGDGVTKSPIALILALGGD